MTDKESIALMRRGNSDGLKDIVLRYTPYVSTIVYNLAGSILSSADIEEVCADVFIALWQNSGKLRYETLCGYIAAISRNKAKNAMRNRKEDSSLDDNPPDILQAGPDLIIEKREESLIIGKSINKLGNPDREIFLRHYYYCESVSSIALHLELSESAVKMKLKRGRDKLYKILRKEFGNDI